MTSTSDLQKHLRAPFMDARSWWANLRGVQRCRLVLALLAPVLLFGCSSHKPGPTETAYLISEPSASVALGYDGSTRRVTLHVEGTGFVPRAAYQFQLRRGTCLKPGRFLTAFSTLTSDGAGAANATIDAAGALAGIPSGIHIDARILVEGKPEANSTACTDVRSKAPTAPLRLFAPASMRTGGSFTATFKDLRTLSLRISALGLRSGSAYAVRIYSGSCAVQGRMIAGLGDLTANVDGSASETEVVHLPSSSGSLYVAVSAGPSSLIDATQPRTFDTQLILCGDLPARSKS